MKNCLGLIVVKHKILTYFFILLFTILESLFIIGLFLPSSVLMFFIGFLIGKKYISIYYSYLIGVLGCLFGDLLSYYLGKLIIKNFSLVKNYFLKYTKINDKIFFLFKKNIFFFIFCGKFISFIRPFVILLSGMLNISLKKVLFPDIMGILIWLILYLIPGITTGVALNIKDNVVFNSYLFCLFLFILISIYLCYKWYLYNNNLYLNKYDIFFLDKYLIKYLLVISIILVYYFIYLININKTFNIFLNIFSNLFF